MSETPDFSVAQHEDTSFYTVTWHHRLPDGTVENVFCGQAELKEREDGYGPAGLWYSPHLPLDTPGFATLDEISAFMAKERSEDSLFCFNCGSAVLTGIQYAYDDPQHYDGVSEWSCNHCGRRWERFGGKVLDEGERT